MGNWRTIRLSWNFTLISHNSTKFYLPTVLRHEICLGILSMENRRYFYNIKSICTWCSIWEWLSGFRIQLKDNRSSDFLVFPSTGLKAEDNLFLLQKRYRHKILLTSTHADQTEWLIITIHTVCSKVSDPTPPY